MDIYFKKKRWKQIILIFAIGIGIGSLLYTNKLVDEVKTQERIKVEQLAEALRLWVTYEDLGTEVNNFLYQITSTNTTVPIIVVNHKDEFLIYANISFSPKNKDKVLKRSLERMKSHQKPIEIKGTDQNLYYEESSLLVELRYYPFFQIGVIVLFLIIAYIAFSSSRRSEQNLVWVGMAKETAHQLGTPISSLIAWVELLKDEDTDSNVINELVKDTDQLEKITERFSKIGSTPELYPENIYKVLSNSISYLKNRISKKIEIKYNFDETMELFIPLSATLFGWVIENLVRNAVDAIGDKQGSIMIEIIETNKEVIIEVTDNGKGLPKSKFKTIFQPGYTTKKRGWGLGLSLSKRIIEIYHKGKILVKSSEPFKATTFRIILKKISK